MTKREFFEAVIANKMNDEIAEFAKAELQKMNDRNEKRANTPTNTQMENEKIKEFILTKIDRPMLAAEVGELVGISTNKASALCRQLVDNGKMTVEEVKVPKKGKQKQYTKV